MNPVSKFTPRNRREKPSSNPDLTKEPVQVYCRLRPLKNKEQSTSVRLSAPDTLILTTPTESRSIRKEVHCKFKHIFCEDNTQQEVFKEVAYPFLEDLLKGKNGLLFTYGVTGSGKTFTLTGEQDNPGIMPKSIYTIFNSIKNYQAQKFVVKPDRMNGFEIQSHAEMKRDEMLEVRAYARTPQRNGSKNRAYLDDGARILDINQSSLYAVFISYIEIYNNSVFDLLDDSSKTLQTKILREDSNKNMYVNGVVEVEVQTAEDAFEYFNMGQKRKRMANTILNSVSSRSHSIFNIRVVQILQNKTQELQPLIPDANYLRVSQLSLVDLAGSERTNRTQNTGQLLREASQINNSLMTLRNCLEILRDNQINGCNKLVPYRDSRLTLLFKNYFDGEGRVVMMLCVNPSIDDFEENIQVMKFAEYTQDVKVTRAEAKYTPCKKTIGKKKFATPGTGSKSIKGTGSFTIGPKLPAIKLDFNSLEANAQAVEKLCNALKTRSQRCHRFNTELDRKESNFRKRLSEVNQANILNTAELKTNRNLLKREKQRSVGLEAKLADMEAAKLGTIAKHEEYEEIIRQLQRIISEKDVKINRNVLEKERTKQKLALQGEKMTQELDAKLRRQREHLNAAMKAKDNKIQKVRELLDRELTPPDVEPEESKIPEKKPEPLHDYNPQQTPARMARRNITVTGSAHKSRRSRSAGEVWLEHNSVKPVPLGTVLQPSMKKRKSVTKLSKASDVTNPKQSKYCLIAQEQDTDGEVETKVYKGDILPTCGGGAQVVFNDVEKLRQQSPTK